VSASPFGGHYINRLDNGQTGFADVAFSNLREGLWSGGADLTWRLQAGLALSVGYDFTETDRDSARREFQIVAPSSLPSEIAMLRPDFLLSPDVIDFYDIGLVETTESDPAFSARLRTHAAYMQLRLSTPAAILTGADDEGEIGVMHALQQPQRESNLRVRLDEYLRFGLHAGIFYMT
jgi:hypothetical protein